MNTIVITGAGSGIGRACALRLGGQTTHIVGVDRDGDSARRVASEVVAGGGSAESFSCDVTRTLALELAARQILVNAVAPGPVRTPFLPQSGVSEERLAQMAASYPGGRLPEAEDVAQAVAFFADSATHFITLLQDKS